MPRRTVPSDSFRCVFRRPWVRWLVLTCAGGLGAGCDRTRLPTVPVAGVVELPGRELTGVTILFTPADQATRKQPVSVGELTAEGRFVLGTYGQRDGAPVGTYRVSFAAREGDLETLTPAQARLEAIPSRYRYVRTTPIRADVDSPGPNQFAWYLSDTAGSAEAE